MIRWILAYIGGIKFLLKDKEIPWYKKVIVILTIIYVISPIEFLPDFILPIGYVDDIILVIFIIFLLKDDIKRYIKPKSYSEKYKDKDIIDDVEYKVEDEGEG